MEAVLAVLVGVLMASSVYLMLRRNLVRFVLGLALISHTANLLIFSSGGLQGTFPPLVSPGQLEPGPGAANALPQALMLTAIVISFSVFAFLLVLAFRTYQRLETVDPDSMRSAEPVSPEAGAAASVSGGPQ